MKIPLIPPLLLFCFLMPGLLRAWDEADLKRELSAHHGARLEAFAQTRADRDRLRELLLELVPQAPGKSSLLALQALVYFGDYAVEEQRLLSAAVRLYNSYLAKIEKASPRFREALMSSLKRSGHPQASLYLLELIKSSSDENQKLLALAHLQEILSPQNSPRQSGTSASQGPLHAPRLALPLDQRGTAEQWQRAREELITLTNHLLQQQSTSRPLRQLTGQVQKTLLQVSASEAEISNPDPSRAQCLTPPSQVSVSRSAGASPTRRTTAKGSSLEETPLKEVFFYFLAPGGLLLLLLLWRLKR